jgi:hypothetical protein
MQQGGFGGGSGGGSGGNRRNAAIAKFLGQLNEKKDALSQAIKTSPLSKGLDGSSPRGEEDSSVGLHFYTPLGRKIHNRMGVV